MFASNYAKYYDLLNKNKKYKKEINFVYKWANKPRRIFDIGCGTANYWKYFPKETSISGIEKSPSMAGKEKKSIIIGDIRTYENKGTRFECATALFNVMNYISDHIWWKNIPVGKNGIFIFDIWDSEKVRKERFDETIRKIGNVFRHIKPIGKTELESGVLVSEYEYINLLININDGDQEFSETHTMYIYSHSDIENFSKGIFEIVDVKDTNTWQKWYKLKRK